VSNTWIKTVHDLGETYHKWVFTYGPVKSWITGDGLKFVATVECGAFSAKQVFKSLGEAQEWCVDTVLEYINDIQLKVLNLRNQSEEK
jgi:hypothetical protein